MPSLPHCQTASEHTLHAELLFPTCLEVVVLVTPKASQHGPLHTHT